jgi:hypothetical protein
MLRRGKRQSNQKEQKEMSHSEKINTAAREKWNRKKGKQRNRAEGIFA